MEPFPVRLHQMLTEVSKNPSLERLISFLPHGRAFQIYQPADFEEMLLREHFMGQKNIGSFSRQLNLYGFIRVRVPYAETKKAEENEGKRSASCFGYLYYHPLFLRRRPELVWYMRRVGAPVIGSDRRKCRTPLSKATIEYMPPFDEMPAPDRNL
jgi:hypothetical protein